ncbi:hypothetical protein [Beijerinckia sp. L45]|uniref:hypothetical protein n=1 Tax=Beijerinckia sp. L45 TaxID=1641855 RepID=UPI00131B5CEC|nr:hypothetical protein [Beijerinckia sp. L45]
MTLAELDEAISVLATMMMALGGVLVGASGIDAANLRYAIDDLNSNADTLIRTASLGSALLNVFDLAFEAGAAIPTLESVRTTLLALAPTTTTAVAIQNIGIQMTLSEEVKVYATTTFTSRQDVDTALSQLIDAFDSAEIFAADNGDSSSFQALIAAHAAIVRDLTTRARPLPNMITYSFGRTLTSHALAQRLYADASRADELVAENKVINPAFMPASGSALSA